MFSRAGDSGRSLLTGGSCSEVAVSTGLTVHILTEKLVRGFILESVSVKY